MKWKTIDACHDNICNIPKIDKGNLGFKGFDYNLQTKEKGGLVVSREVKGGAKNNMNIWICTFILE